jgi:hypothetical protein
MKGGTAVKKTFKINKKKLSYKYNKQLFLINIPSISIALTLLVISTAILPHGNTPTIVYRIVFYTLNGITAYGFITCLIGSIKADIRIKAHTKDTYVEILGSDMVISQHMQTMLQKGKFIHYKKLWVVRLKDIQDAFCTSGLITINAPARLFYQKTDWLKYDSTDNGINFEHWWYNENGGQNVHIVEFIDYYTYGEAIVKRILYCRDKCIEKDERYRHFREEMLNIAANINRPPRISPRYKQSYHKTNNTINKS